MPAFSKSLTFHLTSQWMAMLYTAAVSMGLTFVLGRVLGPEDFGVYSYILTLTSFFFILQDGGFKTLLFREKTLPSPEITAHDNSLLSLALGHALTITAIGVCITRTLPLHYRAGILAAIICFGLQAGANFISSELRAAGRFPRDAVWQAFVRSLGAFGILFALFFVYPEPWAVFSGWSLGILFSLFLSPYPLERPKFGGFRFKEIRRACLALMAIDAATTVYYRCDIILLEHITGESTKVGQYAAAYRFLDGIVLLFHPLGLIWFRKLRMAWEDKKYFHSLVIQMSLIMLGAAILITASGIVFSKKIVFVTFGDQYGGAAQILPWVFAALIFVLPNGILTQAAIAGNREYYYAVAAAIAALVNITLNLILIPEYGGVGAARATIITEAFLGVCLVWGLKKHVARAL